MSYSSATTRLHVQLMPINSWLASRKPLTSQVSEWTVVRQIPSMRRGRRPAINASCTHFTTEVPKRSMQSKWFIGSTEGSNLKKDCPTAKGWATVRLKFRWRSWRFFVATVCILPKKLYLEINNSNLQFLRAVSARIPQYFFIGSANINLTSLRIWKNRTAKETQWQEIIVANQSFMHLKWVTLGRPASLNTSWVSARPMHYTLSNLQLKPSKCANSVYCHTSFPLVRHFMSKFVGFDTWNTFSYVWSKPEKLMWHIRIYKVKELQVPGKKYIWYKVRISLQVKFVFLKDGKKKTIGFRANCAHSQPGELRLCSEQNMVGCMCMNLMGTAFECFGFKLNSGECLTITVFAIR